MLLCTIADSQCETLQRQKRPSTAYMETLQRDIQPNMRAILMDWVVEVAAEYKLVSDTLFLAASFVDRYLSCRAIDRTQLQLVGVAALFLAAKYEEIYPPQLNDFVFVAASTYTREQVRLHSTGGFLLVQAGICNLVHHGLCTCACPAWRRLQLMNQAVGKLLPI